MATTRYHFTIDITHDDAPADPVKLAHQIDKHLMQFPDVILSKSMQLQDPVDLTPWERVYLKGKVTSGIRSLHAHDSARKDQGRSPQWSGRIETLRALLAKLNYQHEGN